MGIFKKLGLRRIALQSIDLVKLIQMYQLKDGFLVYKALNNKKEELFTLKTSFLKSQLFLRNNISDKAIFSQVFIEKQYSPFKYSFPEVKTLVDAGANIGMAAVFFSNLFPEAEIVAIEPDVNNFKLLKQNTDSYTNIHCMQNAVWNKNEAIEIVNPESLAASFMVGLANVNNSNVAKLEGITVSHILNTMKWESIDLFKIDIEGAEKEVFSGDISWLSKVKLLIIETHDRYKSDCTKAVFKALENYDYECEFHHENIFIKFNHS